MSDNQYAAPKADIDIPNDYDGDNPLYAMDFKALQKLYYRSHNVSSIAGIFVIFALLGFFGIYFASEDGRLTTEALAVATCTMSLLIATIVGLILRSSWGRILGIILCFLLVASLFLRINLIALFVGLAGLFAFFAAPQLFGDDRITHKEIKEVWKDRKKRKI